MIACACVCVCVDWRDELFLCTAEAADVRTGTRMSLECQFNQKAPTELAAVYSSAKGETRGVTYGWEDGQGRSHMVCVPPPARRKFGWKKKATEPDEHCARVGRYWSTGETRWRIVLGAVGIGPTLLSPFSFCSLFSWC